jgi:hypothetical protein
MDSEIERKLESWIAEEIQVIRAKGATEDDIAEPVFAELLTTIVLAKHRDEIQSSSDLRTFLMAQAFQHAPSEFFRELASKLRAKGKFDAAYWFETQADNLERGS